MISSQPTSIPRSRKPKTSLEYILWSPIHKRHDQLSTSVTTTTAGSSRLESLPRDIISQIALNLVIDNNRIGRSPSSLIPLFLTSKHIYSQISFESNPELYNRLFRVTFDFKALERRYSWMIQHLSDVAGRGRQVFDLFSDPKSWAIDYKTRWGMARRMKLIVEFDKVDLDGVCDRKQLEADLWNIWFLLTENDGLNAPFLSNECNFPKWITIYYRDDMLKDSLVPGYPRETTSKALSVWCALLSGTDHLVEATPVQIDEKIFIVRPYVFACHKYDVAYAPWHHRQLPLDVTEKDQAVEDINRSKAVSYQRFGHTWKRAPPHFILGIYLAFLRLLERQPARMGLKSGSSTFTSSPSEASLPGLFSKSYLMPSIYHDREWQRNSVSQDPYTSPGLPPLTFKGKLRGFWRGKFLFYDFESYRKILAGNMRGVYTGTFAEQAAEMEFKETIIRIKKNQVGGDGPILFAGFKEIDGDDDEKEQKRIEEGNGFEVVNENEMEGIDEEGWTKEILLTGRCRTSWGWASVRGRIRAWDGLIILGITYSRHAMGRWLWRGYLHCGGYLVGRWRDTFTSESMRGYEGPFGMVRAGDIFYPSHFPKRMEDSLGVAALGGEPNRSLDLSNQNQKNPQGQREGDRTSSSHSTSSVRSGGSSHVRSMGTMDRASTPPGRVLEGERYHVGGDHDDDGGASVLNVKRRRMNGDHPRDEGEEKQPLIMGRTGSMDQMPRSVLSDERKEGTRNG